MGTSPPLTGVFRALRARNAEKVSKMSLRASGHGTPKSLQKVLGTVWEVSGKSFSKVSGECFRSRFLGRGSDEALFSEEKGFFSEKGGGIQ